MAIIAGANIKMSLNWHAGEQPVPGYKLVERLGGGGFGEVWKAEAPGGFLVALKGVSLADSAGKVEQRSLEVIRKIRHPQLVSISGTWQDDKTLVIAMELADKTLLDRFREAVGQGFKGIPEPEVHELFLDAARGLDYLNEPRHAVDGSGMQGIQHRDIKPQNLLLMGGSIKVADYGLARVLAHTQTSHTGSMTPLYAAPEFFHAKTSSQSDQYSLAVTYCHMRGGRPPFSGSQAELLMGHLNNPPDLSMLPESERPAVARALSKNPKDRWPTCRMFLEAVRMPTGSYGTETIPPTRAANTSGPQKPTRRSWVAGAVIVPILAILGVVVALAFRGGERKDVPSPPIARKSGSGTDVSRGGEAAEPSPANVKKAGTKPPSEPAKRKPNSVPAASFAGNRAGDEKTIRFNNVALVLCWCPPTTKPFRMGSPDGELGRDSDKEAQVDVTLTKGFWMMKTEMTQEVFEGFGCTKKDGSLFNGPKLPVETVTYGEAKECAAHITRKLRESGELPEAWEMRLPTEAQWEYAARAGTTTATPFGDSLSSTQANFDGSSPYNGADIGPYLRKTCEAGSYKPNAWGLCDTAGNVFEWTLDAYDAKLPGGSDPFAAGNGASSQVIRGGCLGNGGQICRSARRSGWMPTFRIAYLGFRLAAVQPASDPSR